MPNLDTESRLGGWVAKPQYGIKFLGRHTKLRYQGWAGKNTSRWPVYSFNIHYGYVRIDKTNHKEIEPYKQLKVNRHI